MEEQTSSAGSGFELTAGFLKWIAMITMLIDHTGAAFVQAAVIHAGTASELGSLYSIMRSVGRIAFPLYIFLIVESFIFTRSRPKFLIRLGVFALISEIPFDLALRFRTMDIGGGEFLEFSHQNVFFTLFIGFLLLTLLEELYLCRLHFLLKVPAMMLLSAGMVALAQWMCTDYGGTGVLAMELAWFTRVIGSNVTGCMSAPYWCYALEIIVILIPLVLLSFTEIWAVFDILIVVLYRGSRGRQIPKWFFYAFYPGHLFLLFLLRSLVYGF